MNEDTFYIKIQGKVNVPELLPIGHNYRLTADCSVVSEQKEDNDDGSMSITSKLVPITVEATTPLGKTIKGKDPRKLSQKLRACLYREWETNNSPIPSEDYYEDTMKWIIANLYLITEMRNKDKR